MKKARVYETPTTTHIDTLIIPNIKVFVASDDDLLPYAVVIDSGSIFSSPIRRRTITTDSTLIDWALQEVRKEFSDNINVTVYSSVTPPWSSALIKVFHSCQFKRISDEANPAGELLSESWFW